MSDTQRQALQSEFAQIKAEIERIGAIGNAKRRSANAGRLESMMTPPVPGQLAAELREVNHRVRWWLDSLAPSCDRYSVARVPTPEQMSGLLSELLRAGECLRNRPRETDSELEEEVAEYRAQVERLRDLLPMMQRALLTERARLEQERERITAAQHWARASQQTL